jgi:hypothetical protein
MKHLPGYLALTAVAALFLAEPVLHRWLSAERTQVAQRDVFVSGYVRSDGRYVQPHMQSAPDGNPYNNFSFPGNVNPYTGKVATGNPDTYLQHHDSDTTAPYHTWNGYQSR